MQYLVKVFGDYKHIFIYRIQCHVNHSYVGPNLVLFTPYCLKHMLTTMAMLIFVA